MRLEEGDEKELMEAMRLTAKWTRGTFLDFVEEGFTEEQALALTQTWLSTMLKGAQ